MRIDYKRNTSNLVAANPKNLRCLHKLECSGALSVPFNDDLNNDN